MKILQVRQLKLKLEDYQNLKSELKDLERSFLCLIPIILMKKIKINILC